MLGMYKAKLHYLLYIFLIIPVVVSRGARCL